ncbi:MAG: DUF4347 domain-containing protein, partial [Methylococcales bacterium]|nr:DUF4347 domain-containing protein [Methylococcales bacterium]
MATFTGTGLTAINTILFVDTGVQDYQSLLVGLGGEVEVHLLNAERDGVSQIADILKGRSD